CRIAAVMEDGLCCQLARSHRPVVVAAGAGHYSVFLAGAVHHGPGLRLYWERLSRLAERVAGPHPCILVDDGHRLGLSLRLFPADARLLSSPFRTLGTLDQMARSADLGR